MSKIRLSLRHFFQKQASEEQVVTPKDTEVIDSEVTKESTEEESPEETEEEESTSTTSESETVTEPTPAESEASAATAVREIEVDEAEYNAMVADANSWRTNKAELERLRKWHSNSTDVRTVATSDANQGGSKQSWKQAPWNQ